jgi:4-amino-4-deoxy-L-arabinose transferase-like glycosyltransferase
MATKKASSTSCFLITILVVGALLRLVWIYEFPTIPQSDFAVNDEIAVSLSQGEILSDYARNLGYPAVLSFVYRIYPDPISGRILNVILSCATIYLVFCIGKLFFDPLAGLISALLMALSVPDIMMTSVLCTEVGSLTTMVASFYFILKTLRKPEDRIAAFLSGLLLGAAALFRPVTLVYLPVFLVSIWVVDRRSNIKRWTASAIFLAALLSTHALLVGSFSIASGRFTLLPLMNPSAAYTLLSGTNFESQGHYDDEEAEMYWSWPDSERLQRSISEAIHRITAHPVAFVRLVGEKMVSLLADNTYGSHWAFYSLDGPWTPQQIVIAQMCMAALAQITYFLTLMAGFVYFLRIPNSQDRLLPLLLVAIICASILPHILLEAQPRYHHILLGFLAVAAGFGISGLWKRPSEPSDLNRDNMIQ